jgi:major type 1 subunit fimbrin (pilin)
LRRRLLDGLRNGFAMEHRQAVVLFINIPEVQGNTMNKKLLSTALVATLGALAFVPAASAAGNTGTIQINGKVVADTCKLSVNGTQNGTVTLPTVTTATLNAAVGTTAGSTAFNLSLSGCDTTASTASLNFTTGSNNATDGNLSNTGTAGTNVEVQLLNGGTSGSIINTTDNTNAPANIALTSGSSGTIAMAARYYTKATSVSAGSVSTSATVTFSYQ